MEQWRIIEKWLRNIIFFFSVVSTYVIFGILLRNALASIEYFS